MQFRDSLLGTLRALGDVLAVEGVMVVGSQVPNLLVAFGLLLVAEPADVDELEPPRTLLVVTAERAATIPGGRMLEVRLSAELLSAPCLALVPFAAERAQDGRTR